MYLESTQLLNFKVSKPIHMKTEQLIHELQPIGFLTGQTEANQLLYYHTKQKKLFPFSVLFNVLFC